MITSTTHMIISNGGIIAGVTIAFRYAVLLGRLIDKFGTHVRNVEQILTELRDRDIARNPWRK